MSVHEPFSTAPVLGTVPAGDGVRTWVLPAAAV
jgi:hypothetical protein